MAGNVRDIKTKLSFDGEREYKATCKDINSSLKVLGSEMKLVTAEFGKNDKSIEGLTKKQDILKRQFEEQTKKVAENEKALAALKSEGTASAETIARFEVALNNSKAELVKTSQQLDETENDLKDAGKSADGFGDEIKRAGDEAGQSGGKFEKLGSIVKSMGAAFAAGVAAIGAGVGVAASKINDTVNVYAGFEDSMMQVAATMGMTSEEIANGSDSYKLLEQAAKEAGASTSFSASEAAEALNFLALAGYDAEKSAATLPGVLNLAAAGGMSLASASDLVTDAMSALKMETSEVDMFMDQLAKTSQKSNTDVEQLGQGILKVAGTATTTGQDLTMLNTSLGILADNGIKGAESGTHLRNILLSLASPTDQAKEKLDELGVSVYDDFGNMRQLNEVMGDLNDALGDLSGDEARINAITDIFKDTDLNSVNALLDATTGRFDELSEAILDSEGAAQAMADTMEGGLAGAQRSFSSAVEGMQIEIGSLFATMKQGFTVEATDIIRTFTQNLQEAEGDWSKIGEAVGQMLTDFINMLADALPQVVEIGMQIITMLGSALIDNLPIIVEAASDIIIALVEGLIAALPGLTEGALQLVMALVEGILDNLPALVEAAVEMVVTLATGIADSLPELIPAVVEAIILICNVLLDNLDKILEAAFSIVEGLAIGLIDALPVLIEALPQIIETIIDFIVNNLPKIIEMGSELLVNLSLGMLEAIPQLLMALPQILAALIDGIAQWYSNIAAMGKNIVIKLWEGIASMGQWLADNFSSMIGGIVNSVVNSINGIFGTNIPTMKVKANIQTAPVNVGVDTGSIKRTEGALAEVAKESEKQAVLANEAILESAIETAEERAAIEKSVTQNKNAESKEQGKAAKDQAKEEEKAAKELAKEKEQIAKENADNINKLGDNLTKAIKSQHEEQNNSLMQALDDEIDAVKSASYEKMRQYDIEYAEKMKLLDEEESYRLKAIQAEIDAIDERTKAEDKAQRQRDYEEKVSGLKIKKSQADTSQERESIQKEIDRLAANRQRELILEQRNAQKDLLKQQLDDEKKRIKEEKDALQASKLEELNIQKDSLKKQFDELMSNENLRNEALNLMLSGQQEDMLKLLETYYPDWKDAGKNFSDLLAEGINENNPNLQEAVNDALGIANTTNGSDQTKEIEALVGLGQLKADSELKSVLNSINDILTPILESLRSLSVEIAAFCKSMRLQNGINSLLKVPPPDFSDFNSALSQPVAASAGITIINNFNNPVVREESDLGSIADVVIDAITKQQNITNISRGVRRLL